MEKKRKKKAAAEVLGNRWSVSDFFIWKRWEDIPHDRPLLFLFPVALALVYQIFVRNVWIGVAFTGVCFALQVSVLQHRDLVQ